MLARAALGARPQGFWAEAECAFLNTHQARWQYTGEALGFGFAQGKSMLWRKETLDAHGGIQALAAEIAEDAAATKLVNRLGLKVHLVASPFEQPLGRRSFAEVWARQCRWARLRRVTFPVYFVPELLLGAVPMLAITLMAAASAEASLIATAVFVFTLAYGAEVVLAKRKNWHMSPAYLLALLVRDLLMPLIWSRSWLGGAFSWRGNTMTIGTKTSELGERPVALT